MVYLSYFFGNLLKFVRFKDIQYFLMDNLL